MIRFAPKIQKDAVPTIRVAKSKVDTRSDIEQSATSTATVGNEADKIEEQAAATPSGSAEPVAQLLELSGEPPSKSRKAASRTRKQVLGPKQPEISNRAHDRTVGDLLLDLG